MANFVSKEYNGNYIFREQPNHSYFDKPFDDEDCLFQTMNEIDPYFLKAERKAENINFLNTFVTDPRTKMPVTKMCYDYTKDKKTAIFTSPKKSCLKVEEHELGVRVLYLIQQSLEVEEEDMYNWYRLQKRRLTEKEQFQNFVFEYCQTSKEILYAPCRKLLELYQKWYNSKSTRLIERYPQETYNTHLGLPHVRQCKNVLSDQEVHITNLEFVIRVGEHYFWQENIEEDLKKLQNDLKSYAQIFENSENIKESLEDELKQRFETIIKEEPPETPCLYMPLESLLFLVTAGDYVDLPTEMLLNIKESDSRKYIVMDLPLPSRQGGWHTYEDVVEHAITAMLSIKHIKNMEKEISETNAFIRDSNCFKVYTLQDFMQSSKSTADKLCKFSKILTKWQLSKPEDDLNFQIYSSLDLLEENKSVAIKLEYKPRFGCENLTKYKYLKEWFKLKLIGSIESTCLRLDVTNYQTLLKEPLNLGKLEDYLSSVYQLNCNELLKSLFEFLTMLYSMPLGHYMLRYNPKFKDKLLLCKPSQELTPNTVYLHKLINDDITDIEFITQQNFLKIDENLCNLMHMQHKILPATFSPFVKVTKSNKNLTFSPNYRCNVVQARKRNKDITQSKNKKIQNNTQFKKPVNRSKRKRANRKRREFEALKTKCNELKEINHEIELDRLMLNNV